MIIFTDSKSYAEKMFTIEESWRPGSGDFVEPALLRLIGELYNGGNLYTARSAGLGRWRYAFAVQTASRSQYDLLVSLQQEGIRLPDGIICLAGSGQEFHGQRGRPWNALEGNIHLSISLAPQRPIERFHIGFSILAAVTLIEAIDRFDDLRGAAVIKWVNDLLIDGAKVAGFLAHTSSTENRVTAAVLGIGLNVEVTPNILSDRFVPRAASLRDFIPDLMACNQRLTLHHILDALQSNYDALLDGSYFALLDRYRERSIIVGRNVRIFSDSPPGNEREIAAGRVTNIGDNLELYLDTTPDPVTKGRLILESEHA